jgi:divalent metal cation (Fe/Co/Zn/Cd) transporter
MVGTKRKVKRLTIMSLIAIFIMMLPLIVEQFGVNVSQTIKTIGYIVGIIIFSIPWMEYFFKITIIKP